MSETEKWSQNYSLIQRQTEIAVYHGMKDCIEEPCDHDFKCIRHSRTAELVNRYLRRKSK